MSYLGGLDGDERQMFQSLVAHFVMRLNEERARNADLVRQIDCMKARVELLEAAAYGAL